MTTVEKILNDVYKVLNRNNNDICIGKETLVVAGTAVHFATIPTNADYALIVLESDAAAPGAAIRYWTDGSTPTGVDGVPRTDGSAWDISSAENMRKIQFIEAQAGTHTLFIEYFKS